MHRCRQGAQALRPARDGPRHRPRAARADGHRRRPAADVGRVRLRDGLTVHARPAGRRRSPALAWARAVRRAVGRSPAPQPSRAQPLHGDRGHAVPARRDLQRAPARAPGDRRRRARRRPARPRPTGRPPAARGDVAVRRARATRRGWRPASTTCSRSGAGGLPGLRGDRPVAAGAHGRHAAEQAGRVHAGRVRPLRARVPEPAAHRRRPRLLLRRLLRRRRRGGDGAARRHRLRPVRGPGGVRRRPCRAAALARRRRWPRPLQPRGRGRVAQGARSTCVDLAESVEWRPSAGLGGPRPPRAVPRARARGGRPSTTS